MAGADHGYRHIHFQDFINLTGNHRTVQVQDVSIIFHSFLVQFGLVHAVVVHLFAGIVLAESVIAEEDIFAGHIGKHRIGPVQHRGFDEDELAASEIQRIAGFYIDEVPVLVIQTAQDGFPLFRAVNRCVRDFTHQGRQGTAVIVFIVIHDDIIDVIEVDFALQVSDKFFIKGFPYGVHQNGLRIADQVRVVRRSFFCRIFMSMEFIQFPIDFSYPGHFVCQFFSHVYRLLFVLSLTCRFAFRPYMVSIIQRILCDSCICNGLSFLLKKSAGGT